MPIDFLFLIYLLSGASEGQPLAHERAVLERDNIAGFSDVTAAVYLSNNTLFVGSKGSGSSGSLYVFQELDSAGVWNKTQQVDFYIPNVTETFGSAIAFDENNGRIAVADFNAGKIADFSRTGQVYVFESDNLTSYSTINPPLEFSGKFGTVLSFADGVLIITDQSAGGGNGYVYSYELVNTEWTLMQQIVEEEVVQNSAFGATAVTDGRFLAASHYTGDMFNGGVEGRVFMYERLSNWTFTQTLQSLSKAPGDMFGQSLSLSGNLLAVGALDSVYIFEYTGIWAETKKLVPEGGASAGLVFGVSVSLFGDYLVVGDPYTRDGTVYGFERDRNDAANWISIFVEDYAPEGCNICYDQTLSLSHNTFAIGSHFGPVFVYEIVHAPTPTVAPTPAIAPAPTATPTGIPTLTTGVIEGDILGTLISECVLDETNVELVFERESEAISCQDFQNPNGGVDRAESSACSFSADTPEMIDRGSPFELTVTQISSECFPGHLRSPPIEIQINITDEDLGVTFTFLMPYKGPDLSNTVCQTEGNINEAMTDVLTCSWYNEADDVWLNEGCDLVEANVTIDGERYAKCECTHLTVFAIIQHTIELQDHCALSQILGSPVWIVSIVLYAILLCVAIFQLQSLCVTVHNRYDIKIVVHTLIVLICVFNITIACLLFTSSRSSLVIPVPLIGILFAFSFILSFWTFAAVLSTWARVVYTDMKGGPPKAVALALILGGISVSITVLSSFVVASSADRDTVEVYIIAGTIVVSAITIFLAIGFIFYGFSLINKLMDIGKISRHSTSQTYHTILATKLSKVSLGVALIFIAEGTVFLLSGLNQFVFSQQFVTFQVLFVLCDVAGLGQMIYLYYNVVNAMRNSQSRSGTSIRSGPSSIETVNSNMSIANKSSPSFKKNARHV